MNATSAITRLAALAQETRLALFRLLVVAAPAGLCAGDIRGRLAVAGPTLSFHLKELVHAGLAHARPEGRFIYYTANLKAVDALVSYLTDNCCGGRPCAPARRPAGGAGALS